MGAEPRRPELACELVELCEQRMQLVEIWAELVGGTNLRGDLRQRARRIGRELGQVPFASLEARIEDQNARPPLFGQLAQLGLRCRSTIESSPQACLHRKIERLRHQRWRLSQHGS